MTFLGHETQHFADMARFPDLEPWQMEYRAKLVELAQAEETRERVLSKFREDQGDDPASPHSYANRRVLRSLEERLGVSAADLSTIELSRLHSAAIDELRENTRRLAIRKPE